MEENKDMILATDVNFFVRKVDESTERSFKTHLYPDFYSFSPLDRTVTLCADLTNANLASIDFAHILDCIGGKSCHSLFVEYKRHIGKKTISEEARIDIVSINFLKDYNIIEVEGLIDDPDNQLWLSYIDNCL